MASQKTGHTRRQARVCGIVHDIVLFVRRQWVSKVQGSAFGPTAAQNKRMSAMAAELKPCCVIFHFSVHRMKPLAALKCSLSNGSIPFALSSSRVCWLCTSSWMPRARRFLMRYAHWQHPKHHTQCLQFLTDDNNHLLMFLSHVISLPSFIAAPYTCTTRIHTGLLCVFPTCPGRVHGDP